MFRLVIVSIFFLASLLCVFRAPQFQLWYFQILVTEFSWVFIFLVMIIIFPFFYKQTRFNWPINIVGFLSICLFVVPLISAARLASTLKSELHQAFPNSSVALDNHPFHLLKVFGINKEKKIIPKTLMYDSANKLTLDLYPASLLPRPCIIIVHGGSWSGGDSKQLPELNSHLAAEEYNVIAINYRLAPKYKSPAPIEDIKNMIMFLKRNAGDLNIDANNMILLGRSAGAQIVLAAAYDNIDSSIKGVISYYGPADMIWGYDHPSSKLIMDSKKVMEDYLGGTYKSIPGNYKQSSPLELVHKSAVPTLLIHGQNDPLVSFEHSVRLTDKLRELKVPYYFLSLPWATHGYDYTLNGPSGQLSTYAVDFFVKSII